VTAAIFGLLGVIVGAVINGAVTAMLQRRNEGNERRSAARLVRSELVRYRALALESASLPADHLPQLQDAAPLVWQSYRVVLARALPTQQWEVVARAYAHVDALVSVLVFEPDGSLAPWRSREAERLLAAMLGPVEEAAIVLRDRLGVRDRADALPYPPEFPEQGLVAR
jgi:hypothetical protein